MKMPLRGLPLLITAALLGCASPPTARHPTRAEKTEGTLATLFEATRTQVTTNGQRQFALAADADLVKAAETLLLHYSQSEDVVTRMSAATKLAHLGTRPAWERALELARTEQSPEARASLWVAIAELLQPPVRWPAPLFDGNPGPAATNTGATASQLLSMPELQVVICGWYHPCDILLPPGLTTDAVADEVVAQFRRDDGAWPVKMVDRIPFVPFSARRSTMTLTVRGEVAEALQWAARGNARILAAFRALSADGDAAIREPAQRVVEALEARALPTSGDAKP